MSSSMVEKLQLVVDATTNSAETRFQRLTTVARETGDTSVRSASQVATAADRVAQAQLKAQDAAGALRVAQERLQELHDKGNAKASQLAAAEEKVAAAERRLHLAAKDAAGALREQTEVQEEATTTTEKTRRGSEALGSQLGELKGAVVGLVAGASLADWLADSFTGFTDGARGANALALSMNATVAQGGRLSQLFSSLGLEVADLLEIQAEFATKVGDGGQALHDFGADLQTNRDGTINWALTLEDALVNLQKIPDATKRNALGFQLFGEEGYKQLSRLLTSGMSVEEALDAIGTPFSEEDVAAVQEYDTAMMRLQLASGGLGRAIGREVVPVLADMAEAGMDVLDFVTSIPAPVALATAAAIALGITGWNPTAAAGARLTLVTAAASRQMALYSTAAATGTRASFLLAGGMGAATAAGRGLSTLAGGPLGLALIGAAVAYALVSEGVEDFRNASHDAAVELEANADQYRSTEEGARQLGRRLAEEAGLWDGMAASRRGATQALNEESGAVEFIDNATGGLLSTLFSLADQMTGGELAAAGFTDEIDNQREALGAYGAQQEAAQVATKSLNDLIAEGTTSGAEFAEAVQAAAEAQADQSRTSDIAKAALDAYNATTRDAVQTVYDLISAQLALEDAEYGYLDALDDVNAAKDDEKTTVDEVAQAHTRYKGAALDAANTAADAAVQAARAAGAVLDPLTEANTRADAMLANLREKLNRPGLSEGAKADLQGLVEQLQAAKDKGDVNALVTLTGADAVAGELDQATEDRDTTVRVESRNGPAVDRYLDGLAQQRMALVRVESRNGPAVDTYLDRIAGQERLAIIRVETRGGPDVDAYLDRLAEQERTAVINVQPRGATGLGAPVGAPGPFGAAAGSFSASTTIQQLVVQVAADGAGRLTRQSLAEAGRQYVAAIGAYESRNGARWRRDGGRP